MDLVRYVIRCTHRLFVTYTELLPVQYHWFIAGILSLLMITYPLLIVSCVPILLQQNVEMMIMTSSIR